MKQSLVILGAAMVALFRSAYADTSVTLYGLIDTGIGYAKVDGVQTDPVTGARSSFKGSRIGMTNGRTAGSRWGLRGKEDLGDGLYAVFRLESGFNSTDGLSNQGGRLFGREATLGFGSVNWGEVRLGRQYNVASRLFTAMFGPKFGGFTQLNTGAGLRKHPCQVDIG